jgi:hypothetical protein
MQIIMTRIAPNTASSRPASLRSRAADASVGWLAHAKNQLKRRANRKSAILTATMRSGHTLGRQKRKLMPLNAHFVGTMN